MTNPSGTRWESRLVKYLQDQGFPLAERRVRSGAKDKGDVAGIQGICIEAKNVRKMALADWIDEAEVERVNASADLTFVVFPRRNHRVGKAYVLCSLDQWIEEHK